LFERVNQMWSRVGQLRAVSAGEPLENGCALGGKPHSGVATVSRAPRAHSQAVLLQPVDKSDGAMVPDQQMSRERGNVGPILGFQTADSEHHLMLLRLQTFAARRLLAKVKITADLKAKVGKRAVFFAGQSLCSPRNIVSRYDGPSHQD
jgi:hypothetical protein